MANTKPVGHACHNIKSVSYIGPHGIYTTMLENVTDETSSAQSTWHLITESGYIHPAWSDNSVESIFDGIQAATCRWDMQQLHSVIVIRLHVCPSGRQVESINESSWMPVCMGQGQEGGEMTTVTAGCNWDAPCSSRMTGDLASWNDAPDNSCTGPARSATNGQL